MAEGAAKTQTSYLHESEKRLGRRMMVIEESINGLAFPLLADTFVYLLAIQFHAGNMTLGYISSASYIVGVVLPLVPRIFQGRNQVRCQEFCWYVRAFFSLGYLGVLFLPERTACAVLIATYTLFCMFRIIGIAFNDFTIKSISSQRNRGKVVAEVNIAYQGSSMFFRFILGLVMRIRYFMTVSGMVTLQMVGVAANMVSAWFVGRIPCRSVVEYHRGKGVFFQLKEAMKHPQMRRRLTLRWTTTMAMVVFGMSVPFLRAEVGLSQSMVMFYSVALGAGYVMAAMAIGTVADRLGSRPLVFFASVSSLITLSIWMTVRPILMGAWFLILGFCTNFCLSAVNMLCIRLVTQAMPDEDSLSFNSMVNFAIAVGALAAGFVSGILIDAPGARTIFLFSGKVSGNAYSYVFLFAFLLMLVVAVLSLRLQEVGAWSNRDAAAVVFSLRGIQAVSEMDRLSRETDPGKRRSLVHAMGTNMNNMATSELRELLSNPFAPETEEAVRTLGEYPREELLPDLIRLAEDKDSYVRLTAIGALGSYRGNKKAKAALLSLTDDSWTSASAMACRSLARLTDGDPQYLPLVRRKAEERDAHIESDIDFLIALRAFDREGEFYREFYRPVREGKSATFRQTRYSVIASFLLFGSPRLAGLYEMMNNGDVDDFLGGFLTDACDLEAIDRNYDRIIALFAERKWPDVMEFCLSLLDGADLSWNPPFDNLRIGILRAREMDASLFDVQDALATLYFCYSLAKNSRS